MDSRLRGNDKEKRGNDKKGRGNDREESGNDKYTRERIENLTTEQLQTNSKYPEAVIPDLVGDPLIVDSRLRGNDKKKRE